MKCKDVLRIANNHVSTCFFLVSLRNISERSMTLSSKSYDDKIGINIA